MSKLHDAPVPVRPDVVDTVKASFEVLALPGAVFTGEERVALATAARSGDTQDPAQVFAHHLYTEPASVHEEQVRKLADQIGDPAVVETIGIVGRLSSTDRATQVIGVGVEDLPGPIPGPPTGEITEGLKRRRGHVPMPPGPIPVTLDLIPSEADAFRAMFGPMYMTEEEMADPHFHRSPGLDTPQLETVAARISLINRCFY